MTGSVNGYLPYGTDKTYTRMGKTKFVGGVSTGKVGMSCIDYRDNGVKAKKAWFMFDEGVYCLGTDISSHKEGEVYTCINQTLLRGNLEYNIKGNSFSANELKKSADFDWLFNNGIGYISELPISVNAGVKEGDWKQNSERLDSKSCSDTVLELGISHGENPNSQKYSYFVAMNTTPEKTKELAENPAIRVLSNNGDCQSVWHENSKTLMAVFWKKGDIILLDGKILSVNRGCTLVCHEDDEKYNIYISNPKQNGGKTKISINDNEEVISFTEDMFAGMTQYASISKENM